MQVMSITAAGDAVYETVFMFSHQDQEQTAVFVNVVTDAGQTLKLTPGHFLWSLKPSNMSAAERQSTDWSEAPLKGETKTSRKGGPDGVADISASQVPISSLAFTRPTLEIVLCMPEEIPYLLCF